MSKKKSEHYVNNKELLEALIVYRAKVATSFEEINGREPTKADRSQQWPGKPPITNYLESASLRLQRTCPINRTSLIICSEMI